VVAVLEQGERGQRALDAAPQANESQSQQQSHPPKPTERQRQQQPVQSQPLLPDGMTVKEIRAIAAAKSAAAAAAPSKAV
jgi:hypothetical protein